MTSIIKRKESKNFFYELFLKSGDMRITKRGYFFNYYFNYLYC